MRRAWRRSAGSRRRSAPDRARSARRRRASRARRPSAAALARDTTCPGRSAAGRRARSARAAGGSARRRRPRLVGPTAAVFHSAPSRSSIETKVGSPPMVRRTSPACSRASTCVAEPPGSPATAASEKGLVTRGCSAMRVHAHRRSRTRPRHGSTAPVIGAALCGSRRAGERDVALAGEQARGRVEADPAGAGQVDLGPGVQVGEVLLGARRAVERLHVGLELDQVAGHEAGGEAEMAQDLHQQPGRIAARARAQRQRLLAASARRAPCG